MYVSPRVSNWTIIYIFSTIIIIIIQYSFYIIIPLIYYSLSTRNCGLGDNDTTHISISHSFPDNHSYIHLSIATTRDTDSGIVAVAELAGSNHRGYGSWIYLLDYILYYILDYILYLYLVFISCIYILYSYLGLYLVFISCIYILYLYLGFISWIYILDLYLVFISWIYIFDLYLGFISCIISCIISWIYGICSLVFLYFFYIF